MGLIDDVPTCEELLAKIEKVTSPSPDQWKAYSQDAEEIIGDMAKKITKLQSKL